MTQESNLERNVVFAFGRKNTMYFEYGGTRKWTNLPEDILNLLYSKDDENRIEHVVCLDFTERGGWLILYRNANGGYKLSGSHDAPVALKAWIKGKNSEFSSNFKQKTVRFSIGQGNRFFASAKGVDGKTYYRWSGMPPHAEELLQYYLASSTGSINSTWWLSLGNGDDFAFYQQSTTSPENAVRLYFPKGKSMADVPHLVADLGDDLRGSHLILNIFASDQFFLLRRDGSATWTFRPDALYVKDVEGLVGRILMIRREEAPELSLTAMAG